ncbi:hypothetical protein [Bacillus sp. FSL K6-3431]|uniref:hypothetical protein n=1 Tax=Bacillus sp. FSL K6-3431 TaxID=2921500 RepID=UPI0030F5C4E2
MIRSYLLLLLAKPTLSITEWVDELHRVPFYAIMSDFKPRDVPGIGTFYDFFHRLWEREDANIKTLYQTKTPKKKKKKPKKGEKASPSTPGMIRKLIDRFFRYVSKKKELPRDRLFELFQAIFLKTSAKLGLLGDLDAIGVPETVHLLKRLDTPEASEFVIAVPKD